MVDAQLPPALARLLTACGHEAVHVIDLTGLVEADDSSIWRYALAQRAIIITKDDDFAHRRRQSAAGPAVVWLRAGNTSRRALLAWFEPLLPQIELLLQSEERLVEVR